MKNRATAVEEMRLRLVVYKDKANLLRIKANPVSPVDPDKLNAVHIHIGNDEIIKASTAKGTGYPAIRQALVTFEIWMKEDEDEVAVLDVIRAVVVTTPLSNRCRVVEKRTFGPFNGGMLGTKTVQFVAELTYPDDGPDFSILM